MHRVCTRRQVRRAHRDAVPDNDPALLRTARPEYNACARELGKHLRAAQHLEEPDRRGEHLPSALLPAGVHLVHHQLFAVHGRGLEHVRQRDRGVLHADAQRDRRVHVPILDQLRSVHQGREPLLREHGARPGRAGAVPERHRDVLLRDGPGGGHARGGGAGVRDLERDHRDLDADRDHQAPVPGRGVPRRHAAAFPPAQPGPAEDPDSDPGLHAPVAAVVRLAVDHDAELRAAGELVRAAGELPPDPVRAPARVQPGAGDVRVLHARGARRVRPGRGVQLRDQEDHARVGDDPLHAAVPAAREHPRLRHRVVHRHQHRGAPGADPARGPGRVLGLRHRAVAGGVADGLLEPLLLDPVLPRGEPDAAGVEDRAVHAAAGADQHLRRGLHARRDQHACGQRAARERDGGRGGHKGDHRLDVPGVLHREVPEAVQAQRKPPGREGRRRRHERQRRCAPERRRAAHERDRGRGPQGAKGPAEEPLQQGYRAEDLEGLPQPPRLRQHEHARVGGARQRAALQRGARERAAPQREQGVGVSAARQRDQAFAERQVNFLRPSAAASYSEKAPFAEQCFGIAVTVAQRLSER